MGVGHFKYRRAFIVVLFMSRKRHLGKEVSGWTFSLAINVLVKMPLFHV